MSIQERVARSVSGRMILLSSLFLCLVLMPGVLLAAANECAQCHGDNVAAGHHESELYTQGLCDQCHEGVTTNGDCASCHTFVPQQNSHHETVAATSGNCAECHTNVGDLAACLDCHQGKIQSPHHLAAIDNPRTAAVDDAIACAACHTTMEALTGCSTSSCHPTDLRNAHHATPDATAGNCSECHSALPQVVDCDSCHDADYWPRPDVAGDPLKLDALGNPLDARSSHHASVQSCETCHTSAPRPADCSSCHHDNAPDNHHARGRAGKDSCVECHSTIEVSFSLDPAGVRSACQDCHAPNAANQDKHHDLATERGISCSNCHSDATPLSGCDTADCHGSGSWSAGSAEAQHHDIVRAELGADCNSCHSSLSTEATCDSCHATGAGRALLSNHHTISKAASLGCNTCHGENAEIPHSSSHDVSQPETDCLFCHDAAFWQFGDRVGTAMGQHHDVVRLDQALDCNVCHEQLDPKDTCGSCHTPASWTEGSARDQHHGAAAVGKDCQDCHGLTDPVMAQVTSCESCHTADQWVVDKRSDHHAFAAADPAVDCALCHTLTESRNTNCADCHEGQSAATHHVNNAALACDSCHTGFVAPADCESCHTTWTVDKKSDHHELAENSSSVNCNTCHSSVTTATGCRTCHVADSAVWPGAQLHHTNNEFWDNGNGCGNCHGPGYTPPTEADCRVCHLEGFISGSLTTTPAALHHATAKYASETCGACHTGSDAIVTGVVDCATCHAQSGVARDGSPAMHHGTVDGAPDYTAANCQTCHQGINQTQLDCDSCHDALPLKDGSSEMHHETQKVDPNECSQCHLPGFAAAQNDSCEDCHIGKVRDGGSGMHHLATTAGQADDCKVCHENADAAVSTDLNPKCSQCHEPDGGAPISDLHHDSTFVAVSPESCGDCHTGIDAVGGAALDCATCHSRADVARNGSQVMHHKTFDGAPNYDAGNCATCHNVKGYEGFVAGNDCYNCHTFNGDPAWEAGLINDHHVDDAGYELTNCALCHDVGQAELDCSTCHNALPVVPGQAAKDGKAAMHHASSTATQGTCTDCHASVSANGLNCDSCHADASIVASSLNGSMSMHHETVANQADPNCTLCHSGAEGAAIDCTICHSPISTSGSVERHHFSATAATKPCTACHVAVDVAELTSCEECHVRQQQVDISGSPSMHHNLTIAGGMKECSTCHEGAVVVQDDCSACHLASDKPPIVETHHSTATYETGLCSTCHVGAEAQGIGCASCHGDETQPVGHHTRDEYVVDGNCQLCHTDITLNGASCEACHATAGQASIPETHHDAPLAAVAGDCAVCHQSVSTPDVCANCHASSPHHTTLAAQYGVCEQCHTWPADKDENPQQAACRQCHGDSMHGKNSAAPIHDYRACFSCHGSGGNMEGTFPTAVNVLPFHASPGQAVGFSSSSNALAPGRGTFNMFYSTWGGESRNEDRFGEHEGWEDLARDTQRRTLSYARVQISEQGKTYQVPSFSNIPAPDLPGGTVPGGGGGGTGLEVCSSCHSDYSQMVTCDNLKWRDHESLSRVDLATYQLAESTYLGSYCPDLPPAPANLALNKSVRASDDEGRDYEASRAVDGDGSTRWYVRSGRSEWLRVDLGQRFRVSKVVIKWHGEYAREYDVEVSTDNRNWSRVRREERGSGGTETITFSGRDARYILIDCKRERDRGYSIYELEVYE